MDWHDYITKKDYYTAAGVSLEDAKKDLKPLVTKVRAIRKKRNRKGEHQKELIQQWGLLDPTETSQPVDSVKTRQCLPKKTPSGVPKTGLQYGKGMAVGGGLAWARPRTRGQSRVHFAQMA